MPTVIIYTQQHCGYCDRAMALLDKKAVKYTQIKIDNHPELREEMIKKSGRHTTPQIFINDQAIGGCDDLYQLEQDGELDQLLKK